LGNDRAFIEAADNPCGDNGITRISPAVGVIAGVALRPADARNPGAVAPISTLNPARSEVEMS
jgi:hypothetical protein